MPGETAIVMKAHLSAEPDTGQNRGGRTQKKLTGQSGEIHISRDEGEGGGGREAGE